MRARLRIYTVPEANAVLPRLTSLLDQQFDRVRHIEAAVERWRARDRGAPPDLRPDPSDAPELAAIKSELRGMINAFREGFDKIEESTGAVLKDLKSGVVDFYGERQGELVWLCWRYGEPSVLHWHPLDRCAGARERLDAPHDPRPRRDSPPPTLLN